ncbi:PorP/SprF family type IX secretion system membrane protein [Lacihabitans soyangensis]|jgi:type IX secretion system PorP/SprF family membrane protein|uniref:Type IX secretion system membrane protein PorP/SprF n=1 Tax=Lacihabitans soyangensis TaxID=869394 RepID=A0AAE3GZ90_9BACT|nr:type IX secretion system membrane protein PorP/SprF [Lacihabitans soyangensis]MCP9761928.1 type IX secretion system membrane protein PorP/SprF [Lacihabitans soyangensis]
MKRLFQILILANLVNVAFAQDPQFTQFYAAPLYHNPAFTGSGYAPRLIYNYRNQWPSLNANFITSVISVDHFIEKANSGIGITMMSDAQGNRIKNSEVTALYAYQLRVGEKNFLRMGLQGSYSNRGFDPNGLIFGDQLSNSGYTGNPSADPYASLTNYRTVKNFDVGSGVLFYNPKVFMGLAVTHITQPTVSYSGVSTADGCATGDCIPRKYVVNGGYNINLSHLITGSANMDKEFTITPTFLYKKQGQFSQLDLGAYATYTPLTLGLQYRGIPLKKVFDNFPNQDAIAALVGFRFDNFSVGYSYDFTISGLAAGRGTGGSHEFSISYQLDKFDNDKSPYLKQRKKELACPKF